MQRTKMLVGAALALPMLAFAAWSVAPLLVGYVLLLAGLFAFFGALALSNQIWLHLRRADRPGNGIGDHISSKEKGPRSGKQRR